MWSIFAMIFLVGGAAGFSICFVLMFFMFAKHMKGTLYKSTDHDEKALSLVLSDRPETLNHLRYVIFEVKRCEGIPRDLQDIL